MVKIYAIIHPITGEVKYVGKTVKPLGIRLSAHLYESQVAVTKTHKHNWILKCMAEGLRPAIILLEECDENNWQEIEIKWINFYKTKQLTNTAEGGLGGCGKTLTIEPRNKIRETLVSKIKLGLIDNKNPLRCQRLSQARLGIKLSEETKEKLRRYNTGKSQSIETRLKKSKGVSQYNLNGEFIASYISIYEAAKAVNGSKGNISNVCCGRSKTHKGYFWKYNN